jgi:beta-lactamase class A
MLVHIVRAAWRYSFQLPFLSLLALLLAGCSPNQQDAMSESIHQILTEYPEATVAISVRDLQSNLGFDMNAERPFHAASTMKVPVMIEVFRQADRGRFSLDDSLEVVNEFRSIADGSAYSLDVAEDSDQEIYERVGSKHPFRWLVDRMITRSSNLATNILIDHVEADSVQSTIEKLGTSVMKVYRGVEDIKAYRQGLNNTATSADLSTLLVALARGMAVSVEADRDMVDILSRQEFNSMIPSGLPAGIEVAHKTGWITGIDHDAAIVYPEGREPYVLVILTEGIEDEQRSSRLGARITQAVHAEVMGSS